MGGSEDNDSLTLGVNFSNFDSPLRKQIFRVPGVGKEIGFMARTLTGDRQTDRQGTNRWSNRDRQTDIQRATETKTDGQTGRPSNRWIDRQRGQRVRKTQTLRETERQTKCHIEMDVETEGQAD